MNPELKQHAADIRCDTIRSIGHLGVGHIGGCLSVVELLTVLYFEAMNIDPADPKKAGRDRFICSKGHAGPAVYAALANRGYFPKEKLLTLNQGGTDLPVRVHAHGRAAVLPGQRAGSHAAVPEGDGVFLFIQRYRITEEDRSFAQVHTDPHGQCTVDVRFTGRSDTLVIEKR